MGIFSRKSAEDEIDPSWTRMNALVIAADAPPQGAPSRGAYSRGTIQVLANRHLAGITFRYSDEHWVVAGMQVPVAVDPADPDAFVVDWSAVPTMQQMAEANYAALADPFAASRQVAAAAGIAPSAKAAARLERFQRAVAEAGTLSAPSGRQRAVAMTVTVRGRYESGGVTDGSSSGEGVSLTANSAAVLSVAVAGKPPYAVYLPKFKFPARRPSLPGEPLPALVSVANPQEIEILWAELPGMDDQIAARIADSARGGSQLMTAMSEQYRAAIAQATANPPAAAGAGMPPQMRQMMIENLKRSLMDMPDPNQRQMMINQYRAMGLETTPEELGL